MKPSTPASFLAFILSVFKQRFFILCFGFFVLVVGLQFTVLSFTLSPVVYMGVILIGFIGGAYQVQREVMLAYVRAITAVPFQKNRRSGLTVSFVQGGEYAYSISDPYAGQDAHITRMQSTQGMNCRFDARGRFFIDGPGYYLMGKGGLELNFQLLNSGDAPLEITGIHVYDDLTLNHLRIYNEGVYLQGGRVRLPLQLGKGELLTLQARHKISLALGSNDALFAADFRALPRYILHEIIVEATGTGGNRQRFTGELKTPSGALKSVYVKQWREYEQEEYLFLAGEGAKVE